MKSKKPMLNTILIATVLLMIYMIFYKADKTYNQKEIEVSVNNTKIVAEIANTEAERAKGLMFRNSLDSDRGMLFIFPNSAQHAFWMANTKISLDIIWIDNNKKIVFINHNTPPCTETGNMVAYCTSYKPSSKAKYVLEVNGGWAKTNSVNIGDKLTF